MDHNMIDQQLLALLRISTEQRTPEIIAATAASLIDLLMVTTDPGLKSLITLQREQLKLSALAEFLKGEIGYKTSVVSTSHHLSHEYQAAEVSIHLLNHKDGTQAPGMAGYGQTAEAALRNLRTIENKSVAA
ncbi:hypothetical protein [Pseudomonas gingeri]|uniref:hypothetical protein n=1 Tax=Pseudomonas gingeri TaxID=117681 RepID=UPI00159F8589|nr:hypothetical protein [Pseudomonas gingeri]NWD04075.1 hypothetical protein [Pseudomonas gingeri]NWE33873.1 hypothetical protein [Pseudomonas gingeri]NWE58041.1 hypothetical protein [Pseudomonas gingeri]NWF04400.1 hypothetical protein [Pseudomonas gingeri]